MKRRIISGGSLRGLGVALSLSLLLVACGGDKKDDNKGGVSEAVITPTATEAVSATMESLGIKPGAVLEEPGSGEDEAAPTFEIVLTEIPGFQSTPELAATEPRRGSDGSMSNQALGTATATVDVNAAGGDSPSGTPEMAASPVTDATPVASPQTDATPVASPVASPEASPESGTPVAGN